MPVFAVFKLKSHVEPIAIELGNDLHAIDYEEADQRVGEVRNLMSGKPSNNWVLIQAESAEKAIDLGSQLVSATISPPFRPLLERHQLSEEMARRFYRRPAA